MCAKSTHSFDSFVKEKVDEINFEFDPKHWDSLERELNTVQEQVKSTKQKLDYKWLFYSALTTLILLISANIMYFITDEKQSNSAIEIVSEPTIYPEDATESDMAPTEIKQTFFEKTNKTVEEVHKRETLVKSNNEPNEIEEKNSESVESINSKNETVDSTDNSTKKKKFIIW